MFYLQNYLQEKAARTKTFECSLLGKQLKAQNSIE